MKAMVLAAERRPLVLEERPDPEPGVGEIRLRVEASEFAVPTCISSTGSCPTSGCQPCQGTKLWASSRTWVQVSPRTALANVWACRGSATPEAAAPTVRRVAKIYATTRCSPDMDAMVDSPPIPWPMQPMPLR